MYGDWFWLKKTSQIKEILQTQTQENKRLKNIVRDYGVCFVVEELLNVVIIFTLRKRD